ncbi:carcinoembryonic antigen-related cell adhesion molecule 3-like, partial [Sigmodon hispidus]
SFLTFWHLSTTAHVTTELVPPLVAEGDNVLFLAYNVPEKLKALVWYKEVTNRTRGIVIYSMKHNLSGNGPLQSGREKIYRNGSLLIKRVTQKDTGFYTLRTYDGSGKIVSTTSLYLHVHTFLWKCGRLAASAKPTIELVPPRAVEGRSVLLRVHNPPENIVRFVWFKGTVSSRNLLAIRHILDRKPIEWGPVYSGRETLYYDGSLLLISVSKYDHGLYTLQILRTDLGNEEARVQLQVHASNSLFCNPLTSSQLIIQPVPLYAAEGEEVCLQVYNLPEDLIAFFWYKPKDRTPVVKIVGYSREMNYISWGLGYRQRGMLYNNGSLILQDVTEKDAGMYMLEVLNKDFNIEKQYVEFHVKKYVMQPFVKITDTIVTGGTSLIFTCISPDTDISIRWLFNNKTLKLTERMTMSPTKCGLRIDPARKEDAGMYQCEVSNQFSLKTSLPVTWP